MRPVYSLAPILLSFVLFWSCKLSDKSANEGEESDNPEEDVESERPDAEILQETFDSLALPYTHADSADAVHYPIVLASSVEGDSKLTITWESSHPEFLRIEDSKALVTKVNKDTPVVLKAILKRGDASRVKEFELTLLQPTIVHGYCYIDTLYHTGATLYGRWLNREWSDTRESSYSFDVVKNGERYSAWTEYGYDSLQLVPVVPHYRTPQGTDVLTVPHSDIRTAATIGLAVVGTDVYIPGNYRSKSAGDFSGYWKNTVWTDYPVGIANPSLQEENDELYFMGSMLDTSSGMQAAGYLKNSVWTFLPPHPVSATSDESTLSRIFKVGDDIYYQGYYTKISADNPNIKTKLGDAYWKNGAILDLTIPGTLGAASYLTPFKADGKIYFFGSGSGKSGYWENGQWHDYGFDPKLVYGANVVNGDIFLAGGSHETLTKSEAGFWKNGVWTELPRPKAARPVEGCRATRIEIP